jgi:HSP20 family molecular chaperone IbpA
MSQIPVKLVTSTNAALHRLRQLMKTVHDEIRHRAFRLFQQRGCEEGHELEDWLEAEREVLCSPACEMAETADEVRIHAALPACPVKNLQVDVLPNSITIEGKAVRSQHRNGEKIHFSEFGERRLLRQFDLPAQIDPCEVQATLDNGVLRIVARKAAAIVSPPITEVKNTKRAAA